MVYCNKENIEECADDTLTITPMYVERSAFKEWELTYNGIIKCFTCPDVN